MTQVQPQNLQVKLSLDEGLRNTWNYLTQEYEALDKSSIIRLALNTLAKEIRKNNDKYDFMELFNELDNSEGMTEEEFAVWWNENKNDL